MNDKKEFDSLFEKRQKALKDGDYTLLGEIDAEMRKYPELYKGKTIKGAINAGIIAVAMVVFFSWVFIYESPEDKEKQVRIAQQKVEDTRKGFHCLSSWDGSLKYDRPIKNMLRDPDSYQHVETRITPNDNGYHYAYVTYRAKNGFGGYVQESIGLKVSNSSCRIVGAI